MSAPLPEHQQQEIRHYVRDLLQSAPAFGQLPAEERRKMAHDLVRVLSLISEPGAPLPVTPAPAQALDVGSNDALKDRLAKKQDLVGKDFKGGAAKEGAKTFKELVSAVDFPRFVSGLIEGVYTSIVNSSIKQMQEYGKLLEGVVKSAEEFAQDHISVDTARSYVASTFPQAVEMEQGDGGQRLKLKDDVEDKDVPDFQKAFAMGEKVALDEDNEAKIVAAAQLKMARDRQKMLATMVAMGINRIIVTDGEIKASVLFDVKSKDTAQRSTSASTYDSTTSQSSSGGGFFGWLFGGDDTTETKVSSAYSSEQEKSTAELEARAKLSGSVTVRFKSETFPLEKVASPEQTGAVQEKGGGR